MALNTFSGSQFLGHQLNQMFTNLLLVETDGDLLMEEENETPLFMKITAVLTTSMYASLILVVEHEYKQVEYWKKFGTYLFMLPQFIGFIAWIREDSISTRSFYLRTQYYAYYPLLLLGFYNIGQGIYQHFFGGNYEDQLKVISMSTAVYGILGMILLMQF